jgi:hypothetical protein
MLARENVDRFVSPQKLIADFLGDIENARRAR